MSAILRNEVEAIVRRNIDAKVWAPSQVYGWANEIIHEGDTVNKHATSIRLGQRVERILSEVARLHSLGSDFPNFTAGHGVSPEEAQVYFSTKYQEGFRTDRPNAMIILTKLDQVELAATITRRVTQFLRDNHVPKVKGQNRIPRVRYTQDALFQLSNEILRYVPVQAEISESYSDMCFLTDDTWNICETKLSGDTDDKKTQSTFEKNLLIPYVSLGNKTNKRLFMGISSPNKPPKKDGTWGGPMAKFLAPDGLLVGEQLWNVVAPEGVSFSDFTFIVKQRMSQVKPKRSRG